LHVAVWHVQTNGRKERGRSAASHREGAFQLAAAEIGSTAGWFARDDDKVPSCLIILGTFDVFTEPATACKVIENFQHSYKYVQTFPNSKEHDSV